MQALAMQVSASAAQKKRIVADKKMQANVNKRGMVPNMAVERRKDKLSVGPILLGVRNSCTTPHTARSPLCHRVPLRRATLLVQFFVVVIVGSSLLQVIRTASSGD